MPSKIPNFDQRRLGILNIDGFTKENIKKNIDKVKRKIEKINCIFVKKYRPNNIKNIENTIPKLFSVPIFTVE